MVYSIILLENNGDSLPLMKSFVKDSIGTNLVEGKFPNTLFTKWPHFFCFPCLCLSLLFCVSFCSWASVQSPVRLWAREWGRAGLPGGWHHHLGQSNRRELAWGQPSWTSRILPHQLCWSDCASATLKTASQEGGSRMERMKRREDKGLSSLNNQKISFLYRN